MMLQIYEKNSNAEPFESQYVLQSALKSIFFTFFVLIQEFIITFVPNNFKP
jgi:hypothetical protein